MIFFTKNPNKKMFLFVGGGGGGKGREGGQGVCVGSWSK